MKSDVLKINPQKEIDKISDSIRDRLRRKLNRRGLVVAISGGVDSAVCAALAVKALGKNKVFGLLLPETDSSSASVELGMKLADQLGIEYLCRIEVTRVTHQLVILTGLQLCKQFAQIAQIELTAATNSDAGNA